MALRPQFVAFGDSLTQRGFQTDGWVAGLADAYSRRADVINRGYSGYNSRWALHLLDRAFPGGAPPPVLATVGLGANDAALPDRSSARQHVPVAEYQANLEKIVAHLRSVGVPNIVLIAPPPIAEARRLRYIHEAYGNEGQVVERTLTVSGQYAAACCATADKLGLPCLNLWEAFQKEAGWEGLLDDGLHPGPAGNQLILAALRALLDERFPHLRVESIPEDAPWFADIDSERHEAQFAEFYAKRAQQTSR